LRYNIPKRKEGFALKISLIEPKSPGYHVFSGYLLPRLGLPLLGKILKDEGHEVKIFCEDIDEIDWNEVFRSDFVGISTITSTALRAYSFADKIKEKGIPVVMGGAHPTFMPEEALEHADYVIRGEGEEAIVEFTQFLEGNFPLEKIKNLSYRKKNQFQHNPLRPPISNLDSLPFPDLTLIKGFEKINITPIITSRGCPYNCTFCSVTKMFGHRYRYRSPENVIAEIREKNPRYLFFYDDNFAANLPRAKNLLRMMIEEKLTPPWSTQVRAEIVNDKELLGLMKKSNCFLVHIGLESINPETLKAFNKGQKPEDVVKSVKILWKYGIKVHGMFVLGSDADTAETIRQTVKFAKKSPIFTIQFLILTPLPGTELYMQLEKEKRIFTKNWALYDGHHVVYKPKKMSIWELQTETFKAMRKFYSLKTSLKFFATFRFVNAYYRYIGRKKIKKWIKSNKNFIKSLKVWTLSHSQREL
jgi:radical SAM superfamily enzyme YgiQ (UPF0313 family)